MKITFINLFFVFMALTACSGEKRYVLNQQEELIYKNLLLDHVQTELDGSEVGDDVKDDEDKIVSDRKSAIDKLKALNFSEDEIRIILK